MSGPFARDALHYHAAGANVLPIESGTKHPPRGLWWRRWQTARQTADEVREIADRYAAADIGIVLGGPSGLVDIETDGPAGEDALRVLYLPVPLTACWTSPRGAHRLYRANLRLPSRIKLRDGLDVLASGRYVVAPTSIGREWLTPGGLADVAPLSEAWAELLGREAPCRAPDALHVAERVGVEEGRRNMMLARLVGRWMTKRLPEAEVVRRAHDFAQRCRPPLDSREAEKIVASVFGTRARARSAEGAALILAAEMGLTAMERLVLVGLGVLRGELGKADDEPFAAPVRKVAGLTGQSVSTVSEAYRCLQHASLLTLREGRDPTGRLVSLVVLHLPPFARRT